MKTNSVLSRPFAEDVLETARTRFLESGQVLPAIIYELDSGNVVTPLQLGPRPEENPDHFYMLGETVRESRRDVKAALMIAETWFVDAVKAPAAHQLAPSQHPARQEAITLIGRNAAGQRSTQVLQIIARDDEGYRWGKQPIAVYDQPAGAGTQAAGLLDYLFAGIEGR